MSMSCSSWKTTNSYRGCLILNRPWVEYYFTILCQILKYLPHLLIVLLYYVWCPIPPSHLRYVLMCFPYINLSVRGSEHDPEGKGSTDIWWRWWWEVWRVETETSQSSWTGWSQVKWNISHVDSKQWPMFISFLWMSLSLSPSWPAPHLPNLKTQTAGLYYWLMYCKKFMTVNI